MAYTDIVQLPDPPDRQTDTPTEFSNNTDALLSALQDFVDDVNGAGDYFDTTIDEAEVLLNESAASVEGVAEEAAASAALASSSAADAQNNADTALLAVNSASQTLASATGILGLGIGTSYTDSSGHLQMVYDDGVLTTAPTLNASGNLILTVEI